MRLPSVLTIAGSDSSGGAGIQADLKTIAALGLYGQSAITALTAQNTCGVRSIQEATPQFVSDQIDAVFEDIAPAAVKVGMLSSGQIAHVVAEGLRRHGAAHVVVDPVMVATSGAALMEQGAASSVVAELFPLAQVVTPNIPEASALSGIDAAADGLASMTRAARVIARTTTGAVLVKGGHLAGEECATDVLLLPGADEPLVLRGEPVQTRGTHGTGCTLSSAIACFLALGFEVPEAVRRAKDYLTACLRAGLELGRGNGPLDHMAPVRRHIDALGQGDPASQAAPAAASQVAPAPSLGPAPVPAPRPGAALAAVAGSSPVCAPALDSSAASAPDVAPASTPPVALVVAGSPEAPSPALLRRLAQDSRLVVACDSGADACMRARVRVDVLVGDGDSLSPEALAYVRHQGARELDFPMDKDDTDLGLALSWLSQNACDLGVSRLVACGVTGGRLDHGLGALGVLARTAGLSVRIESQDATAHVLVPGSNPRLDLGTGEQGCTLSVVALLGPALLSEGGMRWNLDHAWLNPLDDLGVSNVVESACASVEVHDGVALVVVERDPIHKASIL